MKIAMPLHRELIKSDFVRHMMLSEISKFLFLTDNNCYCLIHNWISKEGLLLISNKPFFSFSFILFFFVSDIREATQIKSYLVVNFVESHNFYLRNVFLTKETL